MQLSTTTRYAISQYMCFFRNLKGRANLVLVWYHKAMTGGILWASILFHSVTFWNERKKAVPFRISFVHLTKFAFFCFSLLFKSKNIEMNEWYSGTVCTMKNKYQGKLICFLKIHNAKSQLGIILNSEVFQKWTKTFVVQNWQF